MTEISQNTIAQDGFFTELPVGHPHTQVQVVCGAITGKIWQSSELPPSKPFNHSMDAFNMVGVGTWNDVS